MDKVEYDFDFQINEKQCRKKGIRKSATLLTHAYQYRIYLNCI